MKEGLEYFPLDVAVHRSVRLADLTIEEFGLWVLGLSFCNDDKTDGFIPEKAIRGFGQCGRGPKLAVELVKKGRWARVDGGYQSVGFLDHNRSKAEIEKRIADKRAAGKAGGRASAKSRSSATLEAHGSAGASPPVAASAGGFVPRSVERISTQGMYKAGSGTDPGSPLPPEGDGRSFDRERERQARATAGGDALGVAFEEANWFAEEAARARGNPVTAPTAKQPRIALQVALLTHARGIDGEPLRGAELEAFTRAAVFAWAKQLRPGQSLTPWTFATFLDGGGFKSKSRMRAAPVAKTLPPLEPTELQKDPTAYAARAQACLDAVIEAAKVTPVWEQRMRQTGTDDGAADE